MGKVHASIQLGESRFSSARGGVKQSGDGAVTEENEALSWAQAQLQEGCVRRRCVPHICVPLAASPEPSPCAASLGRGGILGAQSAARG